MITNEELGEIVKILVAAYLRDAQPHVRTEFLESLDRNYCSCCGGPARNEHGERCQCWNDK